MVEKTVSRVAQDFLLDAGVSLVINVKAVSITISINSSKKTMASRFHILVGL